MHEPATEQRSLPRNVKVLGFASLFNDVASEMIYPLMPAFLSALGGSKIYLGLIEGLADSISSFLKLWSGGWSDRTGGRKAFVISGYSLPAVARPLIGLVTQPWQLFGLRVFDRIGKGIRTSPRDALIADSTAPELRGRAFGFHRAMDHLGAAIGPLLAMAFLLIWPEKLRALFLLALVPGLMVVGLVLLGLRETPSAATSREPVRLTLAPFDRSFRLYLLALVIFTLGNATDAFLLVRAAELDVPTYLLPALWCAFHVVKSTSNFVLGRGVDRFGPRLFIFIGWLLYAGVNLAFAFASAAWEAWLFFLLYGVFYGLTEPAEKTLVANLVGRERKGLAFGWFNFAIGIATFPASLIFGALYEWWGPLAAFGWSAGLALVAVVVLSRVKRPARV